MSRIYKVECSDKICKNPLPITDIMKNGEILKDLAIFAIYLLA